MRQKEVTAVPECADYFVTTTILGEILPPLRRYTPLSGSYQQREGPVLRIGEGPRIRTVFTQQRRKGGN